MTLSIEAPSRTAYGTALSRAAHQAWDSPKAWGVRDLQVQRLDDNYDAS